MPIAWGVRLDAVAERLRYRDALRDTESFEHIRRAIMALRQDLASISRPNPAEHTQ